MTEKSDNKTEINIDKKNVINDAMNGLYNLKGKYEHDYYNKYIKVIIKNQFMSKVEKRVAYSKLPKPKCVNCKRNVGSIFSIKYDKKTDMKKFIAKCGDISKPCPLDIYFEVGTTETYNNVILEQEELINKYKKMIINGKNDILFGYLDESETSTILETTINKLKEATNTLGFFVEKNILVNSNPSKKEVLKSMIIKFGEMKLDYKEMMLDYDNTQNKQKLIRAVNYYTDDMIPHLKNIQATKYDINIVEHDDLLNNYTLIQLRNSIDNLEVAFDVDDVVHSYVTGITTKKTKKNKDDNKSSQRNVKTRKSRKTELIIEDDDDDDDDDDEVEVIGVPEYSNEAKIDSIGEISWDNPEYQRVWDSLNDRYRNNLSQYPEWARQTIEQFIVDIKGSKYRSYINPPNLIIPGQRNDDGSLDFGNELYNKLYKSTNAWEQSILNTMRPGIKGGSEIAYKNYLEVLFKEKVGFTRY